MYYMLNLVFNYTDSSAADGRFMDYSTQTNPLLTSKVWLQPATGVTAPDPNRSSDWVFFERDKQHLNFDLTTTPTLWVRVVDANQQNDNFNARITILMGRNDQKHATQPMSSPIVNPSVVAGPLCIWDTLTPGGSVFVPASTTPGGGTVASWLMALGVANQGSSANGPENNYIFLVAATVIGTRSLTFSHDPDMDITC